MEAEPQGPWLVDPGLLPELRHPRRPACCKYYSGAHMSVLLQNRVKLCLGSKLMGDITLVYMVEIVTVCKYRVDSNW